MAKWWRPIRQFVQSVPIPGVGISVQQAKDIGQTIKKDPGGTVIYQPPPQAPAGDGTASLSFRSERYSPWFLLALVAGGYVLLTMND